MSISYSSHITHHSPLSDVESTTVGKVAFGWRPIDMLLVRGSWSEAFRAPNLITINERGQAQLRFVDETKMVIGPNSQVTIDSFVFRQKSADGLGIAELGPFPELRVGILGFLCDGNPRHEQEQH